MIFIKALHASIAAYIMLKHPRPVRTFLLITALLLVAACANVVAPTGGPKDEDPPVVLRSTPPNFSTYYKGQDVRIFFNEFVELKNLRQNMLISPPLQKDPEIRVRGRSIIMSVSDTLRPNTTYNFFFGESIVDITEGNPIPNFQFVVSTGSYVDSLSVRGEVINALTLQPEEGVFVMMYDDVFDSVPMLQRPVYVAKTNKEGRFVINNMRDGEYLMFALRDSNFNYLYDSRDEKIAFLDSLVRPQYFAVAPPATENGDNGIDPADETEGGGLRLPEPPAGDLGVSPDTLAPENNIPGNDPATIASYTLFLFQERDTIQRILSASSPRTGKVSIAFRIPVDTVLVRDYVEPVDFLKEFNATRDTLGLWFTQTQRDSLFLEVITGQKDPDSLKISLIQRAPRGRGAAPEAPAAIYLTVPTVTSARRQPFFRNVEILSPTPISDIDPQLFTLWLNDSIPLENFEIKPIGEGRRRLEILTSLKADSTYTLKILPGAVTDIFGLPNDTLTSRFKLNTPADYATLLVNLGLPVEPEVQEEDRQPDQYLLQLLNDKWEVLQQKIVTSGDVYTFEHLPAANFRLRLVLDENRNGKWDTGNYLRSIQPEKVVVYPEMVQTRLNWEVEIIWDFPGQ